jgi:hypothetical protein
MSTLEAELVALGRALDAPSGDYLATRVRATVNEPAPRVRRRVAVIVAALVVAAGAAYTTVPAVAEWLGVKGVDVRLGPPATSTPTVDGYDLGHRVTMREAQAAAGFELVRPRALGEPAEVWIDDSAGVTAVWFVYTEQDATYPILFMQADVGVADNLLATKFAEPGVTVQSVALGTGPALWIEGAHMVAFENRGRGDIVVDQVRLSQNVLLWEQGPITLRLELAAERAAALRIAESAS